MLEISFNELSSKVEAASKAHAQSVYADFMSLADNISDLKIAPLRIRSYIDLGNTSISKEFCSLKDWLKTLPNEERQRYVGYIVQDPIIVDNPAYYYEDLEAKGFGYAVNNDLCSISYSTNKVWIAETYQVQRLSYQNKNSDGEIDQVTVRHCLLKYFADQNSEQIQRINHENYLREVYQLKQNKAIKSLASIDDFWDKRNLIFPHLDFSPAVLDQMKMFGSLEDTSLKKSMGYLARLNNHLQEVNQGNASFEDIPGDVSNDSEATLDQYGEQRILATHDGQTFQYSLHAKLGGDTRIYLKPRPEESRITIGYIGNHMRTKKNK